MILKHLQNGSSKGIFGLVSKNIVSLISMLIPRKPTDFCQGMENIKEFCIYPPWDEIGDIPDMVHITIEKFKETEEASERPDLPTDIWLMVLGWIPVLRFLQTSKPEWNYLLEHWLPDFAWRQVRGACEISTLPRHNMTMTNIQRFPMVQTAHP